MCWCASVRPDDVHGEALTDEEAKTVEAVAGGSEMERQVTVTISEADVSVMLNQVLQTLEGCGGNITGDITEGKLRGRILQRILQVSILQGRILQERII